MERKELLGAIFDEIAHHFRLFTLERYVYLALAVLAGLSLATAIVVLVVRPYANPSIAVAILGGSGLIAFAAARSTAFFHQSIRMMDDVVKRWSKLSEPEMRSAIAVLQKRSETSVLLISIGFAAVLGSVVFAFARVSQIGEQIEIAQLEATRVQREASSWRNSLTGVQQAYAALKNSVTALYPAHITRDHQAIEVKAVAQPQPKKAALGPTHSFRLALHAAPGVLATVRRVRYQVRLPDAAEQLLVSEDAASGFAVSYAGSACVANVDVTLELRSGATDTLAFDQCRALGPQWTPPTTVTAAAR